MKLNLKGGLTARVVGGAIGGASSALFDNYLTPHLPASIAPYASIVKAAVGIVLPMVAKNSNIVRSLGDGLLTVGIAQVIGNALPASTPSAAGLGSGMPAPFNQFALSRQYVGDGSGRSATAARKAVGVC